MKYIDEEIFNRLILKEITKEEFLKAIDIDINRIDNELFEMLDYASEELCGDNVEIAIYLIFKFDLFQECYIEKLNNLIICNWHEQHENIAILLQRAKHVSSVKYLKQAVKLNLNYLDWDDNFAFEIKCIWTLGSIANEEAKRCLEELSRLDNQVIAENAKEQLDRIKI